MMRFWGKHTETSGRSSLRMTQRLHCKQLPSAIAGFKSCKSRPPMGWQARRSDAGKPKRGRKLSDGGAKLRFYYKVCKTHLARIVRLDRQSELFTYSIHERALKHAQLMDGKLLLVTSVADLGPKDAVRRYKSLVDIERGFRVLNSEIEIGPIYHRLPARIRARAAICFMALILYRVIRSRLPAGDANISPDARGQSCAAFSISESNLTTPHPLPCSPLLPIHYYQKNIPKFCQH